MDPLDAEEFSLSLAQIGAGWWRQIAWAFRQEVPEALGMSRRGWAEKYHGYMRMPIEDRREAVAELAAEGMSTREIADALGVSQTTIVTERNRSPELDSPSQAEPSTERNRSREVEQVDLEEAIDAAIATAVLDTVDPSGAERQQQADLIAAWSKAHATVAKKIGDLNSFELEGIAPLLDEVGRLNAKTGIDLLRSYCTRMDAALSSSNGLHVVKGGKK